MFFEKEGNEKKPGTAGWYNSAAFHRYADEAGLYAKSINGDAFSAELKDSVIDLIKQDLGQIDLVVYSLAAPRRTHPVTGDVHISTLKPIGSAAVQKGINTDKGTIQEFHLEPASQEEIGNTVAVMGGEDWQMWIEALDDAGVRGATDAGAADRRGTGARAAAGVRVHAQGHVSGAAVCPAVDHAARAARARRSRGYSRNGSRAPPSRRTVRLFNVASATVGSSLLSSGGGGD